MEVDEYGAGSYFCDHECFHNIAVRFTAVSATMCEILTIPWNEMEGMKWNKLVVRVGIKER